MSMKNQVKKLSRGISRTLKGFYSPDEDSFAFNLTMLDSDLIRDSNVVIPNWIPGLPLSIHIDGNIDLKAVREKMNLVLDDQMKILVTVKSNLTHRIFTKIIFLPSGEDAVRENIQFDLQADKIGGTLSIAISFVVNPCNIEARLLGSPAGENSIIWEANYGAVIQRGGALASVITRDLEGAIWAFEFDLPDDPREWVNLEWNDVVTILIDTSKRDLLAASHEMKGLLLADLISKLLDRFFEYEDALEIYTFDMQLGSFGIEMLKHLKNYVGFKAGFLDQTIDEWKSNRDEICRVIQLNALKSSRRRNV